MVQLGKRRLTGREPAQVMVLFAVFIIMLMVLADSNSLVANAALPAGTPVAIALLLPTNFQLGNLQAHIPTGLPGSRVYVMVE